MSRRFAAMTETALVELLAADLSGRNTLRCSGSWSFMLGWVVGGGDVRREVAAVPCSTPLLLEGSGAEFNPHVTIGVATQSFLDDMLAEPFATFAFSPSGATIFQVGTFGTAAQQLKDIRLNR